MLKRTPLYDAHVAAGAKMVDFGGWQMPLHYGSQVDEHHAVRRGTGLFDVSHMRAVDLSGNGVCDFLRQLLANDVARLVDGKALYSCMLREDGGVIDDLIVYRLAETRWRLVVNAGTADKDLAWIAGRAEALPPEALQIRPREDLAMIAVQGPGARELLGRMLPEASAAIAAMAPFTALQAGEAFVARTGYTGEDGCEVALPATAAVAFWDGLVALGAARCGLGARDTLRLEAGMNLYGQDMDETVSPLESGLAWTVDLREPRPFVGRAALEAQQARGGLRRLAGLALRDRAAGVLRAHQAVRTAHGDGEITSGTFAPTLGFSVALARLPGAVADGDEVRVEMRGRSVPVQVVKYPFVRNGRSRIG